MRSGGLLWGVYNIGSEGAEESERGVDRVQRFWEWPTEVDYMLDQKVQEDERGYNRRAE